MKNIDVSVNGKKTFTIEVDFEKYNIKKLLTGKLVIVKFLVKNDYLDLGNIWAQTGNYAIAQVDGDLLSESQKERLYKCILDVINIDLRFKSCWDERRRIIKTSKGEAEFYYTFRGPTNINEEIDNLWDKVEEDVYEILIASPEFIKIIKKHMQYINSKKAKAPSELIVSLTNLIAKRKIKMSTKNIKGILAAAKDSSLKECKQLIQWANVNKGKLASLDIDNLENNLNVNDLIK